MNSNIYIPSVIKNYTSKGASRLFYTFYITLRERLVPNIALLNDVFLIEQWRLILYLNFKTLIFNAILHKNCGVSDLGTRRIEFRTVQNVSLCRNISFCKFGQRNCFSRRFSRGRPTAYYHMLNSRLMLNISNATTESPLT